MSNKSQARSEQKAKSKTKSLLLPWTTLSDEFKQSASIGQRNAAMTLERIGKITAGLAVCLNIVRQDTCDREYEEEPENFLNPQETVDLLVMCTETLELIGYEAAHNAEELVNDVIGGVK